MSSYPDIAEALYASKNIEEARLSYIATLRKSGDIYNTQYAAKLEQSIKMLSPTNLRQLEKDFAAFKDHMRQWSKKTGIKVFLTRRQKDFLGLNAKIRLYLATDKNLATIKDLLGFRIVLQTEVPDTIVSIKHCYDALNETIRFFATEREALLLEAEPRSGTACTATEAKKLRLVVPKESLILKGFQNNVKDYIRYPKKNGYQSLHLFIQNHFGVIFEIQIRTTAMDILAEHGTGKHDIYKSSKYLEVNMDGIDLSKIKMPGFVFLPNGEIYDRIGLKKSIDPFNLL